jgi:hypothetical protein
MSSPRAATSVATSACVVPSLKASSALMRVELALVAVDGVGVDAGALAVARVSR